MKYAILPLAIAGMMTALPAVAQQNFGDRTTIETQRPYRQGQVMRDDLPNPGGQTIVGPVEDVVLAVEQRLQNLGYAIRPDGEFDADLRNSVLLFQSDYGLRPTGNVDLATLAALGIDVDPSGMAVAQVQPLPGDQMAMVPADDLDVIVIEEAEIVDEIESGVSFLDGDYPLLRSESMSSPQIAKEANTGRFENDLGIPRAPAEVAQEGIPGIEPGYIEHEWE